MEAAEEAMEEGKAAMASREDTAAAEVSSATTFPLFAKANLNAGYGQGGYGQGGGNWRQGGGGGFGGQQGGYAGGQGEGLPKSG